MNLTERSSYKLFHEQMRPDELRKYIKEKRDFIKRMERNLIPEFLRRAKEAEKELRSRPKTKRYGPGLYWDHSAIYNTSNDEYESYEELVIVDHKGEPWKWFGSTRGEWHCFGKSFNETSTRIWEKVGNL